MNPHDHFFFVPEAISPQQEQDFISHLLLDQSNNNSWTQLKRRRLILAGACPGEQEQKPIAPFILGPLLETVNKQVAEKSPPGFLQKHGITLPFKQQEEESSNKLNILINEYNAPNGILLHTDGPAYQPCVCIISLESTVPILFTPNVVADPKMIPTSSSQQTKKKNDEDSMYDDSEDNDDDDAGSEDSDEYFQDTMAMYNWHTRAEIMKRLTSKADLLPNNINQNQNQQHQQQLQDSRLYHPRSFAVLLPPRSMIVFSGELYKNYLHGILENFVDVLPVSKILNFSALFAGNSGDSSSSSSLLPLNVFQTSLNTSGSGSSSSDYLKLSKSYLGLLYLSRIKAIDRVDALNKDYDKTVAEAKQMMRDPHEKRNDGHRQQYFLLENNSRGGEGSEKYFVMLREKRRISLTYRRVV